MCTFFHSRPSVRRAACAALLLATSACVAPPPPIVLRPPAMTRHPVATRAKEATRNRNCERPARSVLTEAEKARLFDEFDGWQDERRPPGTTADAPVPPPAPKGNRAVPPGCRVSRD